MKSIFTLDFNKLNPYIYDYYLLDERVHARTFFYPLGVSVTLNHRVGGSIPSQPTIDVIGGVFDEIRLYIRQIR